MLEIASSCPLQLGRRDSRQSQMNDQQPANLQGARIMQRVPPARVRRRVVIGALATSIVLVMLVWFSLLGWWGLTLFRWVETRLL